MGRAYLNERATSSCDYILSLKERLGEVERLFWNFSLEKSGKLIIERNDILIKYKPYGKEQ